MNWEFRKTNPARSDQPWLEWQIEQLACVIMLKVCLRARKRGDKQTFRRARAIIATGAHEEATENLRIEAREKRLQRRFADLDRKPI